MTHRVCGPELAEVPSDGGKWAIYCEHYSPAGEVTYCAILQDTNRRRLAEWMPYSAEWCEECATETLMA